MREALAMASALRPSPPWRDPLAELDVVTSRDGITYFLYRFDFGAPELGHVFGAYFGYPPCCVEAFCREQSSPRGFHPASGHRLCVRCAAGPMAPLPPRPAERYGLIIPPIDGDEPPFSDKPWIEEPAPRPRIETWYGRPAEVGSAA
jgi:hypothetical protein